MQAAPYWEQEDEILIYNIDTYVEPGWIATKEFKGDGFIPCFDSPGDHWSFVKLSDTGEAVEIREKKRISNHCSVGAYYFKSAALYESLYRDYYIKQKNIESGELYIAPLYNHLLQQGGKIYINDIPSGAVHVLGTPEEVQAFQSVLQGK